VGHCFGWARNSLGRSRVSRPRRWR
jgi:hypothetical protein